LRQNYIKRCQATGGDTISVVNGQVYVNGVAAPNPPQMQMLYKITARKIVQQSGIQQGGIDLTKEAIINVFSKYNVNIPEVFYNGEDTLGHIFAVHISKEVAAELQKIDFIKKVELMLDTDPQLGGDKTFPHHASYPWTMDNFGPLYVPKKGDKLPINTENLILYGNLITKYDGNKNAQITNDKLLIDGVAVTEYEVKQNYYFMMGDNRHNSLDSRAWGFVPEDHVIGKGLLVWFSVEAPNPFVEKGLLSRIRWNRIFNIIR
jgi:signal peptidase I